MNLKKENNLESIQGIRGLMALSVFNAHYFSAYFIWIHEILKEKNLYSTPLTFISSGGIPVSFFFVVSSFFVTRKMYCLNAKKIIGICMRRYFRFLPMIILGNVLAIILIRYTSIDLPMETTFARVLRDACYDTFKRGSSYIGPLWLIRYQFWCIWVVALIIIMFKQIKYRHFLYLMLICFALYTNNLYLYHVLLGMFASDIYYNPRSQEIKKVIKNKANYLGSTGGGIICFSTFYIGYKWNLVRNYQFISGVGWALLILSLALGGIPLLSKFFKQNIFLKVGKISYAIYVVHYLVQRSFAYSMKNVFSSNTEWRLISVFTYIGTLSITIVIAYVFTIIDTKFQKQLNLINFDSISKIKKLKLF